MEGILLELFTSPTCPHCPTAKSIVGNVVKKMDNALLIVRDVSIPENAKIAAQYGIRGVPTLIINRKHIINGVPGSESELLGHLQGI